MLEQTNQNDASLLVICEDCRNKFEVNSKNGTMHFKIKYEVNGQTIFLSFYDCPICGRRHYVQVDNIHTLRELRECERQFAKLAVVKSKGKEVPHKQSVKFKKACEHLALSRTNLMKELTGKLVHDSETDSDIELVFSV